VSPYGDLAEIKLDYWITIEVKNLKKIANPQAFFPVEYNLCFLTFYWIQPLYCFRGKMCKKLEKWDPLILHYKEFIHENHFLLQYLTTTFHFIDFTKNMLTPPFSVQDDHHNFSPALIWSHYPVRETKLSKFGMYCPHSLEMSLAYGPHLNHPLHLLTNRSRLPVLSACRPIEAACRFSQLSAVDQ
jgi:hypothetical protein